MIGALDAARDLTVAHTSERVQFGRPLSKFQAVQHSLAEMAGEIERARAATELAIAAAADFGFDSAATDYAVTVAKIATGRAVESVTTIAHQLHGAIGVTVEHRLWLFTMRARSWIDDFGTTTHYARRLGRLTLAADDPVAGRRQLSRTALTRASTSTRSPRSVRSIPNRSVSAFSTSVAVAKRIRSVLPALWIARLRPRRFQRASSVTSATDNPTTKTDFGCVETYQLPTSRSIRGRGRVVNIYSVCHSPRTCASRR